MKRMAMVCAVGMAVLLLAVCGGAVEWTGSFSVCVDLMPGFSSHAEVGLTTVGESWSFSSNTKAAVVPAFGLGQVFAFSYDLGFAQLSARTDMELLPWTFGSARLALTADVLSATLMDGKPSLTLGSTLSGGVLFDQGFGAFADASGRLALVSDGYSLVSATTLELIPVNLTSVLQARIALGSLALGDEGGSLENSLSLQQSVVPFVFSFVRWDSTLNLGAVSIANHVTYSGGKSVHLGSAATARWEFLNVRAWVSYRFATTRPLAAGICLSLSWDASQVSRAPE